MSEGLTAAEQINQTIIYSIMPATVAPTLPIKTLLEINAALSSLDGTPTIVKGEKNENGPDTADKIVTVPYQFSGKVRWGISKNLNVLKRVSEDFGKTRDALINEVSNGTGRIEPDNETAIKTLNDKVAEVFATEEDTKGLLTLPLDGLNLDLNQIPVAVLAALEPIIAE